VLKKDLWGIYQHFQPDADRVFSVGFVAFLHAETWRSNKFLFLNCLTNTRMPMCFVSGTVGHESGVD